MATSKIQVFKTHLTPQRNALVDNIEQYLANCYMSYNNGEFQYQKIEMNMSFKLTMPQDVFQSSSIGNYVRLEEIGKVYYFFILDYLWISENCVAINCVMDTVNTFDGDLYWSEKTNVLREHKDRWKQINESVDTSPQEVSFRTVGSFTKTIAFNDTRLIGANITKLQYIRTNIDGSWNATIDTYDVNKDTGTVSVRLNFDVMKVPCRFGIGFHVEFDAIERNIDKIPEGIDPVLYGGEENVIYDKDDRDSWYVIYNTKYPEGQTVTDSGQISTLLCKDTGFTAEISSSNVNETTITPSQLENNTYYVIDSRDEDFKWRVVSGYDSNNKEFIKTKAITVGEDVQTQQYERAIGFYKTGDLIYVENVDFQVYGQLLNKPEIKVTPVQSIANLKLKSDKNFVIYKYPGRIVSTYSKTLRDEVRLSPTLPISTGKEEVYINAFNELDRTQSSLVKIIKFPYCPIDYKIVNNVYKFDALVGKDINEKLKVTLLDIPTNVEFGRVLDINVKNPLLESNGRLTITPTASDNRELKYESKLYHSEFYAPKLVYDSFSFNFDLEKVNDEKKNYNFNVKYKPSRVFNSSFLFTFPEYKVDEYKEQDYNNILVVNRNNEMPIFSSNYLNYVRNGYNYDVKAKNAAIAQAWGGLAIQGAIGGLGVAGVAGSAPFIGDFTSTIKNDMPAPMARLHRAIGLPGPEWNPSTAEQFKYDAASLRYKDRLASTRIVAGIGAVGAVANTIASTIQAERSLKQKIADLKSTSMSVSNSDDIDLLQGYSGNKAKLISYGASNKMKKSISDLFHYAGYKTEIQKIPNFSNRYWFNYVQAEPVFEEDINVYENFLDDIKARYAKGVTIYHNHFGDYDWDQVHENWETWLVK